MSYISTPCIFVLGLSRINFSSYGSYSPPSDSSSNSYGNSNYGSYSSPSDSSSDSYGSSNYGSGNYYNSDSSSSSSTMWSTSTSAAYPASTSTYSTPSYGSGSSSWSNGGDYNDCVQREFSFPVFALPLPTSLGVRMHEPVWVSLFHEYAPCVASKWLREWEWCNPHCHRCSHSRCSPLCALRP